MSLSRMKAVLATAASALAMASAIVVLPAGPAAAAPPPLPDPDSFGITTTGGALTHPFLTHPRIYDAEMSTAAIMEPRGATTPADVSIPVKVRFLLPADYDPGRAQPYDVLYLLHGGADNYQAWSSAGDIVNTLDAADHDFAGIVVMPEAGRSGWYADWAGRTDGNFAPRWETFHINQLVPWVDANFNTSGTREGRIVAGLSMGGYGALRYAGRRTDLFSAIGAFSPGTDINEPGAKRRLSESMLLCGACVDGHGELDGHFRVNDPAFSSLDTEQQTPYRLNALFGPTAGWPQQNPKDLAGAYNAYDSKMGVYVGGADGADAGEVEIRGWTATFHGALVGQGVTHRYCSGDGGHNFEAWRPYLTDFIDYVYLGQNGACPVPE